MAVTASEAGRPATLSRLKLSLCSLLCYLRCVSSWLSVSSAHSGRQLCRPGRRHRPAGLPTWRNAKANKQETILSQQPPNMKLISKNSLQIINTVPHNFSNWNYQQLRKSFLWLHGLIYHQKRHQTTLWFVGSSNHIWLFHHRLGIIRFCSVYYDVETTIVAITGLFVSAPYTYDVETTIVAITGLLFSAPYTTMLKQQS